MSYVPLEKLIDKSQDSVYKLVILASKRALEIAEGQPRLVNVDSAIKPSTVALYEIAEGKVRAQKPRSKENK
ncbi:MAG: DNA-directed RNA polymerase subunit omega [Candidatus Omnitrophica bacterium]|nr:DNA-directed RNA polymerase subunit omega [Candidatus Omnitrophota bacterium]